MTWLSDNLIKHAGGLQNTRLAKPKTTFKQSEWYIILK
jgi:hypothetical protein